MKKIFLVNQQLTHSSRGNHDLYLHVDVQLLHCLPVSLHQTSVMNTNTEGQGQLEVLVLDVGEDPVHLHVVHVEPLLGVVLGGEELEQLQCCDPGLLINQRLAFCCVHQSEIRKVLCQPIRSEYHLSPAGHEYQDWFGWTVLLDTLECWLVHGGHPS